VSNNATPLTPGSALIVGPGAGGAIYSRTGLVIATDCLFSSNLVYAVNGFGPSTPARGGAICVDGGWLQMTNCSFIQNGAVGGRAVAQAPGLPSFGTDAFGGAVFSSGAATAYHCWFLYNETSAGAGVAAMGVPGASTSGSPGGFASGGAIYNDNGGAFDFRDCTLINNAAFGGPGGSGSPGFGAAGSGGKGGDVRGAVIGNAGALWVWGCTFATNRGVGGDGGLFGIGFPSGTQGQGTAGGSGGSGGHVFGAIYTTNSGLVSLTNCTIAGNALSAGSAQSGGPGNSCLATGCTIGGAGGPGGNGGNAAGGLYVVGGTSFVVHCTFDRNAVSAGTNGLGGSGGQGRTGNGPAGANGIAGVSFGAALSVAHGSVRAANSIFSRSQGSTNCSGVLHDFGSNLSSDNSVCFTNPASIRNVDAGLAEVSDNGGPTPTLALTASSPAYNRGSNVFSPLIDQRGVPRPQGKFCDIGAFEAGHLTITQSGLLRYGAPPGSTHRLQSRRDWGEWRDLATNTAGIGGYAHYGPIPLTNRLELFRTETP
jgi:hypothetical protein